MLPCLFLTRPEADSLRFAQAARAAGWRGEVLVAPLLRIVPAPPSEEVLSAAQTLVATSQHAIAALVAAKPLRDRPIWCVGPRTAQAAQAAGFGKVHVAAGDAQSLRAALLAALPEEPVLHLRGDHAAMDIAAELRAAGLQAEACVVYEQVAQPLTDAARARLGKGGDVVLPVFSPRSARLLVAAMEGCTAPSTRLHLLAISSAAQAAAQVVPWASQHSAARPDGPAMIAALGRVQAALEPAEKPRYGD